MKRTFPLYYFFLSALVLTTCRHHADENSTPRHCNGCCEDQSIDGFKSYFYFKTGTWWVYQEQDSGDLDTVTVYEDLEGTFQGVYGFEWKAYSSYFDYSFGHYFDESHTYDCLTDKDCDCYKLNRDKFKPGDYVGGGNYFTYPIILNNYNYAGGMSKVISLTNFEVISNLSLYSLAEFDIETDESTTNLGQHTRYKWAKNTGIVEFKNLTLNTHWKIIDYHINQ